MLSSRPVSRTSAPAVAHAVASDPTECKASALRQGVLPAERAFYDAYDWCLDPHSTVRDAIGHLRVELERLKTVPDGWQSGEVATNIYLLSCALLNSVDEYLRGPTLRMPKPLARARLGRGVGWAADKIIGNLRLRCRARARRWRERWQAGLDDFLAVVAAGEATDPTCLAGPAAGLAMLLQPPLPADLQLEHIGVPSAFRRLDVTHFDVLALGERFAQRFADRSQPILVLGLRTGGSYFAPLLRAFFKGRGYQAVSSLTVQPDKGPSRWERRRLKCGAERGCTALIVDDPPQSGDTIFAALDLCCRAGFHPSKIRALVPIQSTRRSWHRSLPDEFLVSLEPEQWHKHRLLASREVEDLLAAYFRQWNFANAFVVASSTAKEFNSRLQGSSSDERGGRLKRVYEVHLETPQGETEVRYVLAKSVGWGWLGYHAFLAGHRLSGFVPPLLGLRDGILYMEWIPQSACLRDGYGEREAWIERSASYVAARVRSLSLGSGAAGGRRLQRHQNGLQLLERVLCKAYGRFVTDTLMRPRLQRRLSALPCAVPTLIDGNMGSAEWIVGPHGLLKTDYEHHGMGKAELNVVDPAYDLAEVILNSALSPDEENALIRRYVEMSGDAAVGPRLFVNKLLAALWAMESAEKLLFGKPQTLERHQEFHRRWMSAWNFLTVQTARYCGAQCRLQKKLRWHSPLVFLDVDGVLDRRLFGFPCTTAAGMKALSLLSAHGISVALNTARSAAEVKDYCDAYSLVGGVAEYGSYLWDAVDRRGRVLIGREAARQLSELMAALRKLPGVFLDDRHQYSIRAFTYQDRAHGLLSSLLRSVRSSNVGNGGPAPLPTFVIHHLMTTLGLDRLAFHHTSIDTTVVAADLDKGTGLVALRDWMLGPEAETVAIGDSEADLPMFRVATRSFAPAQISCARQALLVGCEISPQPYQRGLLDIVHSLVHADGKRCQQCADDGTASDESNTLFLELLQAADETWRANLLSALCDPRAFRIFLR